MLKRILYTITSVTFKPSQFSSDYCTTLLLIHLVPLTTNKKM